MRKDPMIEPQVRVLDPEDTRTLEDVISHVSNLPTADAIADFLVAEKVVAFPAAASECALAAFFYPYVLCNMGQTDGKWYITVNYMAICAESHGQLNVFFNGAANQHYDLGTVASDFIRAYDHCRYSKLIDPRFISQFKNDREYQEYLANLGVTQGDMPFEGE